MYVAGDKKLPCDNGPYIWDKSPQDQSWDEGIGSIFQFRKPSLIARHILNGSWIGRLINAHYPNDGDQSSYFGLTYPHCNFESLEKYENENRLDYVYVPKDSTNSFIKTIPATRSSVIVFDWEKLDEYHNYIAFDEDFREQFHQQRLLRQNLKREPHEIWVSIHFRWGDVETKDPNDPDERTGLGFDDYCRCMNYTLTVNPNVSIFIFAENFTPPESCRILQSKQVQLYNESTSWKRDLDIMSQSQLLIGGQSSFFVVGAHLCKNCTVIHTSGKKFTRSKYETKNLEPHLNPVYCTPTFDCYLPVIKDFLEKLSPNKSHTS